MLLLALGMALAIAAPSPTWIIGISVCIGLGYGGSAGFLPTCAADAFGCQFFGRNWAIIDMFNRCSIRWVGNFSFLIDDLHSLGYCCWALSSGAIYDSFKAPGSVFCTAGQICYRYTFVMLLCAVAVAICANIALILVWPAPECAPISMRRKTSISALHGFTFFHFLGHIGLNLVHRRHRQGERGGTVNKQSLPTDWDASNVQISQIASL